MIRYKFSHNIIGLVALTAALVNSAGAQTGVPGDAIGGAISGVNSIINQLEDSARSLIEQGNGALAQQQMLLAGILSGLVQQLQNTYATELDKSFADVSLAEANTYQALLQNLGDLTKLETQTATDLQATIYKTQGSANQLLSMLPFVKVVPVFYGITVRDLANDPDHYPADIEVLGFHLSDDRLKFKAPIITVASVILPPESVSVQADRIQITLPDDVRKKIGFGNAPCAPRNTFNVTAQVFYGQDHGIWPITWTSESKVLFNANALPGARLYTLDVSFAGTRTVNSSIKQNYSAVGGSVNMGCQQSTSGNVVWSAPGGATAITCSASWVNTSNVKASSQNCAVGGTTVTGTGSLTGRDKQCVPGGWLTGNICNCPGGGHGSLQIAGSYTMPVSSTTSFSVAPGGTYVLHEKSSVFASIPADSTTIVQNVSVVAHKKQCDQEYDELNIATPNGQTQLLTQTSKNGLLKGTLWNGQLTVFDIAP